jgi:hypothetical protein
VKVPANWLPKGEHFLCIDPIKGDAYPRSAELVNASGLHVELKKWDYHFFLILKA